MVHDTKSALEILTSKALINPEIASDLLHALELWYSLQGMLRLTIPKGSRQLRQHDSPVSLRDKLVRIGGVRDYDALLDNMDTCAARVLKHFNTIICSQAASLETKTKTTL